MSTRNSTPPRRSLRPLAESWKPASCSRRSRPRPRPRCPARTRRGTSWTLTLYGPGTLNVVDKNGQAFTKANQNIPDDINTITVSGTVTAAEPARGQGHLCAAGLRRHGSSSSSSPSITRGPTGSLIPPWSDPRWPLLRTASQRSIFPTSGWGIRAERHRPRTRISTRPRPLSAPRRPIKLVGGINAPEGVNTLRFGGVDTTYTPAGGTPLNQTNQNNEFVINLGPPIAGGTSIIVNKVISDAGKSTASGTTTVFQDAVTFVVNGRINLFQANEIDGSTGTGLVPTQFIQPASSTTALLPGGTYLVSDVGGGVSTGQIGDIRIGGNVTNFTAMVLATDLFTFPSADPATGPQVSNFFIGGETNNVILVAPAGVAERTVRPWHGQHLHQHRVHPEPPGQPRRHRLGGHGETERSATSRLAETWSTRSSSQAMTRNSLPSPTLPGDLAQWPDHPLWRSLQRPGPADDLPTGSPTLSSISPPTVPWRTAAEAFTAGSPAT